MSKYPKTDDNAFNSIHINLNSKVKVETFKEREARINRNIEIEKAAARKEKRIAEIEATRPMFSGRSVENAAEAICKWENDNKKALINA
jgi:hypothetical protein